MYMPVNAGPASDWLKMNYVSSQIFRNRIAKKVMQISFQVRAILSQVAEKPWLPWASEEACTFDQHGQCFLFRYQE